MDTKTSMLLANMMSQKPKIMYATIKGTLTENDGVFSGFSGSNYLELQQPFKLNANTVAEFLFKINLSSVGVVNGIMATPNSYGISFIIGSNNLLRLYMGNGSSWTLLDRSGQTTISTNTDYFIKLTINKGNVSCVLSADKINWITQFTDTITITEEYTYNLSYGLGRVPSSQYLRGSIDLPHSYIKLGSTKYKLQAVVGYTIVGSPTIVDGVVSGFSSSDYLIINDFPKSVNFSGKIRAKLNAENSGFSSLLRFQRTSPNDRFSIENQNTTNVRIYHYNESTGSNSSNTIYSLSLGDVWIDYIFNYNRIAKTINIKAINVNNNSIVFDITYDNCVLDNIDYVQLGYMFNGWNGSIDMNETYIKINNKLWFNGQPA